jgi:hypothetical protein
MIDHTDYVIALIVMSVLGVGLVFAGFSEDIVRDHPSPFVQWLVSGVYWALGGVCLFIALQILLKLW